MRPAPFVLLAAAALGLSACSSTPSAPAPAGADPLLERHGLAGLSGKAIVERLDGSPEQRPLALSASVRESEVVLGDGTEEIAVALPADEFYVSVAPYVDGTHECYFHSLATCTGELAERDLEVRITDASGRRLVDEETTTYANGFVGFWLPRDVNGTIEVSTDGYEGQVAFSTGEGDPTCITTLRLDPVVAR